MEEFFLTNDSIIRCTELNKRTELTKHINLVRQKYPKLVDWSDSEIEQLYKDNNSYSQSRRCKNGGEIEKYVEKCLTDSNIPFSRQVSINKDGIIVSAKKNMKVIDIVFGNVKVGDHISNYKIMSLKNSSRERYTEDDWTLVHKPKLYIYATLDTDYPSPDKFQENEQRILICTKPKKDDKRKFKLGFENIVDLARES